MAAPGPRVDRLANEEEPADLDGVSGLLEQLSRTGRDHRLAGVDAPARHEPVRAAPFLVADEEHLPVATDEDPDPDPDRTFAHRAIIRPPRARDLYSGA